MRRSGRPDRSQPAVRHDPGVRRGRARAGRRCAGVGVDHDRSASCHHRPDQRPDGRSGRTVPRRGRATNRGDPRQRRGRRTARGRRDDRQPGRRRSRHCRVRCGRVRGGRGSRRGPVRRHPRRGLPARRSELRGGVEHRGDATGAAHRRPVGHLPTRTRGRNPHLGDLRRRAGRQPARQRHPVRPGDRAGRGRAVVDLRHHRPHELRPRRADHLRCDGGVVPQLQQRRSRAAAGHRDVRGDRRSRPVRCLVRARRLPSAAPPRHADRVADGRLDRTGVRSALPVQHHLRRRLPAVLPVRRPGALGAARPCAAATEGPGRRRDRDRRPRRRRPVPATRASRYRHPCGVGQP
eukprot:Opistho-1_new@13466